MAIDVVPNDQPFNSPEHITTVSPSIEGPDGPMCYSTPAHRGELPPDPMNYTTTVHVTKRGKP
jgi:hypothetical protein